MKRLCTGFVPAITLFLTFIAAPAQQTAVWETVDMSNLRYAGNHTDVLAGASDRDFVIIGAMADSTRVVRRTTDGGETWSMLRSDKRPGENWKAVAHPDPNLIVIVGDSAYYQGWNKDFIPTHKYWGRIQRSEDGGNTWTTYRADSNTQFSAISMCNPQHGVIVQANRGNLDNPAADLPHDSLLRTTDGWKTWTAVALPDGYETFSHAICIQPDLYVVYAHDAGAQNFVTFRTTDGGVTWQRSGTMPRGLVHMTFLDPLNGWAAGGVTVGATNHITDRIARTTDGGITWTIVYNQENGENPMGLIDIDFADANNGIAVGRYNKILRTSDGGATWIPEFPQAGPNPQHPIAYLEYVRPDFAMAVYTASAVIRYTGKQKLVAPSFIRPVGNGLQEVRNVTLEWTPVEGATEYHIVVASQPITGGPLDTNIYNHTITDQTVTGTSIVLNDLQYNHYHFARVQARNATLQSDWHTHDPIPLFSTKKNAGVVLPPHMVVPEDDAREQATSLTVTWEEIPGATSYDLQVGTSMLFLSPVPTDVTGHPATSYTVTGLKPATLYFIRVRAHLPSQTTDWSSVFGAHSFTTAKQGSSVEAELKMEAGEISIFPNPVTGDAMVEVHGPIVRHDTRLEICNALGERVRIIDAGQSRIIRIPTTGLAAGTYRVRLLGGASNVTAPLVIVR